MDAFGDLSEANHDQIRKYLTFFRTKREGILRTLKSEFDDARSDRLDENMYSKEDVEEYSDYLASAVRVCLLR